ncbi:MAG: HDIG domain-containing protein [Ignavibacteriae bacterium]|nr:HDIG domain-containing protein [Ignavibacteriota bacterium]
MNRQDALNLLHEFTKSDSLRKHAYAVEAAMRSYARKFGEDEETWGVVGLLHDFDYEMHPTVPDHPMKGSEILRERGLPEDLRTIIISHVPQMQVPRESRMAKCLFACDELCGLIVACALVRPNKLEGLGASSVKKKLKDKAFARTVSREDIQLGIEEMGVSADEHIQFVVAALATIAADLGLG